MQALKALNAITAFKPQGLPIARPSKGQGLTSIGAAFRAIIACEADLLTLPVKFDEERFTFCVHESTYMYSEALDHSK